MRFVHIADMHFDMQFKMLSDKIGIGEQRRYDQRVILRKIINYIKENNIKYFFIAGDLYENQYIRTSTIEYINKAITALIVLCFIIYSPKSTISFCKFNQ